MSEQIMLISFIFLLTSFSHCILERTKYQLRIPLNKRPYHYPCQVFLVLHMNSRFLLGVSWKICSLRYPMHMSSAKSWASLSCIAPPRDHFSLKNYNISATSPPLDRWPMDVIGWLQYHTIQ